MKAKHAPWWKIADLKYLKHEAQGDRCARGQPEAEGDVKVRIGLAFYSTVQDVAGSGRLRTSRLRGKRCFCGGGGIASILMKRDVRWKRLRKDINW